MNEPTDAKSFVDWVMAQGSKLPVAKAGGYLKKILGIDPAETYVDMESELAAKLGRPLSAEERFALRPVIAQFDEYYEEE